MGEWWHETGCPHVICTSNMPTCHKGKVPTLIDYFVIHPKLAQVCSPVTHRAEGTTHPHTAAVITIQCDLARHKVRFIDKPRRPNIDLRN